MHEYTPPSQCEACVPVVTATDNCTHLAHQDSCPNRKDTK